MDKVIVVKIGGAVFGSQDTTIEDIIYLQKQGKSLVIVHGGGNLITEWLTRQGISTQFVHGERVTDKATLEVATALLAGLWIPVFYYCGLNQFIVQRTLAAKSLRQGQLGIVFAAALWLLVPFVIVMPGIISLQLYGDKFTTSDQAFPFLIRNLIPAGIRGFMFAAIIGAVMSSLASMLNSASTIFTMDIVRRYFKPGASQGLLVAVGRIMTVIFVIIGCLIAPQLSAPRFSGVFHYIQEFQGYISPGILACFVFGFIFPLTPASAGVAALLVSAPVYGILQWKFGWIAFLNRMAITFGIVILLMAIITVLRPLREPKIMPVKEDFDMTHEPLVAILGGAVIVAVIVFYIIFW